VRGDSFVCQTTDHFCLRRFLLSYIDFKSLPFTFTFSVKQITNKAQITPYIHSNNYKMNKIIMIVFIFISLNHSTYVNSSVNVDHFFRFNRQLNNYKGSDKIVLDLIKFVSNHDVTVQNFVIYLDENSLKFGDLSGPSLISDTPKPNIIFDIPFDKTLSEFVDEELDDDISDGQFFQINMMKKDRPDIIRTIIPDLNPKVELKDLLKLNRKHKILKKHKERLSDLRSLNIDPKTTSERINVEAWVPKNDKHT